MLSRIWTKHGDLRSKVSLVPHYEKKLPFSIKTLMQQKFPK